MIARRPFVFEGRAIEVGEAFTATPSDAERLVAQGDAEYAARGKPSPRAPGRRPEGGAGRYRRRDLKPEEPDQ
jgi:hypothetical protein